ncbi:MAG TPA: TlpA disulfide reductase family protein [Bryobacteraceae bacterium]|nr:TlpA disulfide reductase family protein [Bryobacteraceae bacterium]
MRKTLTLLFCAAVLFAADVNRRAPGFSLVDAHGVEHDLADYRGKLVLLAFTQTNCPHCAVLAETLQEILEKNSSKVAVLAVVNPPDNPDAVRAYVAGHKITYPVLFDTGQMAYSYVLNTNMQFPHLYVIDGGGTIRKDWLYGPLTRDIFEGDQLKTEVDRLLNAGSAPKK